MVKTSHNRLAIDANAIKKASTIFRALYHPLRLQLVGLIDAAGKTHVTPLIRKLKLEQSLVSAQLKIMREAKILLVERQGQKIIYSVNYPRVNKVITSSSELILYKPLTSTALHHSTGLDAKATVRPGTVHFTARELKVIRLVCREKTSAEMADQMGLSTRTIEEHRASILKKTKARNSVGILIYAIKNGLFKL